jgi:hypothetical protein
VWQTIRRYRWTNRLDRSMVQSDQLGVEPPQTGWRIWMYLSSGSVWDPIKLWSFGVSGVLSLIRLSQGARYTSVKLHLARVHYCWPGRPCSPPGRKLASCGAVGIRATLAPLKSGQTCKFLEVCSYGAKKMRRIEPIKVVQPANVLQARPTSAPATPIHAVLLAEPSKIWGHLQPGQRLLFGRSFAGVHQNLANYQFLTQIMFAFQ